MASQQNQVSRNTGYLTWLAVPRGLTLPVLLLLGSGIGQLIWLAIDSVKILSWLSGLASPFCMLCATAVWAMRDKAEISFNTETMNSDEYRNACKVQQSLRDRSTKYAAITSLAALVSASPAISQQLIGPIWQVMVVFSGAAVGFSVHSYLLANYWDHQLREHRSKVVFEQKRLREQQDLVSAIERSSALGQSGTTGWSVSSMSLTPPADH